MILDFSRITGPRLSPRENFEDLVCQLLALEIDAQALDGAGGDRGIDCFRDTDLGLEVFQAKYFLAPLTPGQRSQAKRSLRRALEHRRLRRWVLCVPHNPTPGELEWFVKLAPPGVTIEWWGASKLRSLLSKHVSLAEQFFAGDRLERRFEQFEREVRGYLLAALHLPLSATVAAGGEPPPVTYLKRAQRLGDLLLEDGPLLDGSSHPTIAIDFSEIYSYLQADSRLAWARPVFDFCIEESPFALVLLPPSVLELHWYLESLRRHGMMTLESSSQAKEPLDRLKAFVEAFEQNPASAETRRAFDLLDSGTVALPRLASIIQSGRLKVQASRSWQVEAGDIEPIVRMFVDLQRGLRPRSQFIDAAALALIRNAWTAAPGSIRMLSSAPSFLHVARQIFDQRSPVRTSQEYAYFVHMARRAGLDGGTVSEWALALRQRASRLASVAESGLSGLSAPQRESALAAFAAFAPSYRDLLRPVDEMISSAASVTPRMRRLGMEELYRCLVAEAQLVEGFRRWWEQICATITAIRQSIRLGEPEAALSALYERLDQTSSS
jgi:hypothetical protein